MTAMAEGIETVQGGTAKFRELDTIRELPAMVKHIKVTGDGGLEIVLTARATKDGGELNKVRELLLLIQGGVLVDFRPAQESLPM